MVVYYNEPDKFAAKWLKNLIFHGHIADGDVDERCIEDVRSGDLSSYKQCHFFAGIGTWSYALRQSGWSDDVPVWTGSCPCQPFSIGGVKLGFSDKRHLWPDFYRLIAECQPPVIFGEQVASKLGLAWLDLVQTDMEAEGYAFGAVDLCAASVGSPSIRQRVYWVADSKSARRRRGEQMDARRGAQPRGSGEDLRSLAWPDGFSSEGIEPVGEVLSPSYGVPGRVGRLRAYGNAIVPQVAEEFIRAYLES